MKSKLNRGIKLFIIVAVFFLFLIVLLYPILREKGSSKISAIKIGDSKEVVLQKIGKPDSVITGDPLALLISHGGGAEVWRYGDNFNFLWLLKGKFPVIFFSDKEDGDGLLYFSYSDKPVVVTKGVIENGKRKFLSSEKY